MDEKENIPATTTVATETKKEMKPAAPAAERKKLSPKVLAYIVYTVGAGFCLLLFLLLFGGGGKDEIQAGALTELPDPSAEQQELSDKQDQYTIDITGSTEYGDNLDDLFTKAIGHTNNPDPEPEANDPYADLNAAVEENNRTLAAFNESLQARREEAMSEAASDGKSSREAELEQELALMQRRLEAQEETNRTVESIMEEGRRMMQEETEQKEEAHRQRVDARMQRDLTAVSAVPRTDSENVVSTLGGSRHTGFYGIGGSEQAARNTIQASVYGKQVIMSGQQVKLRLGEPLLVGTQVMPSGSILTGTASVGVDRLYITVTDIVHNQVLTSVNLEVYDMDGQRGLFVPGSLENEALRDLGKELTNSLAGTTEQSVTSLVNTTKASEQLKIDLARGGIQGVSRFIEKKLDQIKITVQDGHRLLLSPNTNR